MTPKVNFTTIVPLLIEVVSSKAHVSGLATVSPIPYICNQCYYRQIYPFSESVILGWDVVCMVFWPGSVIALCYYPSPIRLGWECLSWNKERLCQNLHFSSGWKNGCLGNWSYWRDISECSIWLESLCWWARVFCCWHFSFIKRTMQTPQLWVQWSCWS